MRKWTDIRGDGPGRSRLGEVRAYIRKQAAFLLLPRRRATFLKC